MKSIITILSASILIFSCDRNRNSLKTNPESVKQDTIAEKETNQSRPTIDIIYETENFKLYGDTTIDKDKISHVLLKFEPYIGFADFKSDKVDHKKYAELDLNSHKDAGNFRTRLKDGYNADTANFAGHYSLVYWGCGSACQSSLLIDRKTGKIYDSPGASLGYAFRVDSRMLIVNPPDTNGFYYDCSYCKPIIYIFDEQTKSFNEQKVRE